MIFSVFIVIIISEWTEKSGEKIVTEESETENTVTDIKVSFHPQILSVRGILKQSDSVRNNKIAPLEFSDTHISASWTEIGLAEPETSRKQIDHINLPIELPDP